MVGVDGHVYSDYELASSLKGKSTSAFRRHSVNFCNVFGIVATFFSLQFLLFDNNISWKSLAFSSKFASSFGKHLKTTCAVAHFTLFAFSLVLDTLIFQKVDLEAYIALHDFKVIFSVPAIVNFVGAKVGYVDSFLCLDDLVKRYFFLVFKAPMFNWKALGRQIARISMVSGNVDRDMVSKVCCLRRHLGVLLNLCLFILWG